MNISVLSEDALQIRISALMTVLRGQTEVELMCLNSRENFDSNKQYLKKCIEQETIPEVRKILEKDLIHIDRVQVETVTARQFYLVIRYREEVKKETSSFLNQIEKLIRHNGFIIKQADKSMFKQILAVYWNGDVTTEYFEDFDGERWVILNDE